MKINLNCKLFEVVGHKLLKCVLFMAGEQSASQKAGLMNGQKNIPINSVIHREGEIDTQCIAKAGSLFFTKGLLKPI